MIKNLIEVELGYINTNHPDFVGGTNMLLGMVKADEERPGIDIQNLEEAKSERFSQRDRNPIIKPPQQIKE